MASKPTLEKKRQGEIIEKLVAYFPDFIASRQSALVVKSWTEGRQYDYSENLDEDDRGFGRPFAPEEEVNSEHENLRGLSPNNFGGLIVTTLAQTAYMEGITRPGKKGMIDAYRTMERNRWSMKQMPIHREAIGAGAAYGVVLPGKDALTGKKVPKMTGKSMTRMSAFYDLEDDEWAEFAIEAEPRFVQMESVGRVREGWSVKFWDPYGIHDYIYKGDGNIEGSGGKGTERDQWEYVGSVSHDMKVTPVARCVNRTDLDGNTYGEIEPVLPLLRRIDQDTFDRLINQRFGAWQVRYIAGMAKPPKGTEEQERLRLSVEKLLISTNKDTKFGTLPGGDIEPQIKVTDADLRLLSAIAQIPPHHLLGLSSNLQAEALAAAEAGLHRKGHDFRTNAEEFHEQMARLVAVAEGDMETAAAWDMQIRWRDTESRSFAQTVQALAVAANQLKIPFEMRWERMPNWTDNDSARAKDLVESGALEKMISMMEVDANAGSGQPPAPKEPAGAAN
jgi:hypothetical protein